jgi:hypothetical protein
LRAEGATRSGTRAVQMRRGQVGIRPTNGRTKSRSRPVSGPQGRSIRWRWSRLGTEAEGSAPRGQAAAGAVVVSWRRTQAGATVTSVRCTAHGGGRSVVRNVRSACLITLDDTAIPPNPAPSHPQCVRPHLALHPSPSRGKKRREFVRGQAAPDPSSS